MKEIADFLSKLEAEVQKWQPSCEQAQNFKALLVQRLEIECFRYHVPMCDEDYIEHVVDLEDWYAR